MNDEIEPGQSPEKEPPNDPPAAVQWMMQQAAAGQLAASLPADMGDVAVSALAPISPEAALAAREERVADALRGNDRLTEGLDEATAESLLALGLDMGRLIVRDTAGLNDAAAEDVLQPRVRAVRRLLMAAGRATDPAGESAADPAPWLEQAAVALGDRFAPPDQSQVSALGQRWRALYGRPREQVEALRRLIEDCTGRQP